VSERVNPLERKPDTGKPHVRFDERGVETECMTGYSGTGNRKAGLSYGLSYPLLRHSSTLHGQKRG
jgi:hypothetical protein